MWLATPSLPSRTAVLDKVLRAGSGVRVGALWRELSSASRGLWVRCARVYSQGRGGYYLFHHEAGEAVDVQRTHYNVVKYSYFGLNMLV